MGTKRKQHSAQFKAQVAMSALSGDRTLAELASEYGVHQTMISTWKQELVKNAKDLFERGNKKAADPQAVIDNLHRKIGQLQVERDFFRFNRRFYPFNAFRSLLGISGDVTAPTYAELYSTKSLNTTSSRSGS